MAGTFSGLSIVKSGLFAQRAALEVTSNNVANANTEGYTRQRAVLSANKAYLRGGLNTHSNGVRVGNGVDVEKVEAMRDVYMDAKIINHSSTQSYNDTSNTLLKRVEKIINQPGDANIGKELDAYWSAWQDLANDPSDTSLRKNLIEKTNSLMGMFKEVDSQLKTLQGKTYNYSQGSIENQIQDCVKEVNSLGQYIADLNREIARSEVSGQEANELRDKRQLALEDLSELVNVDAFYNKKGELTVTVGNHCLVQHEFYDGLNVEIKNRDLGSTVTGSDKGYPEYSNRPEVCQAVLNHSTSLNQTTITVSQVATAHSQYSALTYQPLTGPLSDFGITSGDFVINGKGFYLDAEHTTISDLAKTINDSNLGIEAKVNEAGQLVMNSTQTGTENAICTADGTSNLFRVLNLQDETVAKDAIFNFGDVEYTSSTNEPTIIEGVTLKINGKGVADLDLRPTITGGKLKALLENRDGVIQETIDGLNELAYSIMTETNAVHRIGYGLDGQTGNNFFTAYNSGDKNCVYRDCIENMSIDEKIKGNLNYIACSGGEFVNEGDRLPTMKGTGDGSNAILIAQLKQQCFFNNGKSTFNDYYNEVVTNAASKSQFYENELEYSSNVLKQLESQRSSQTGVSLDEELSNLIKFQHAYNASAKCLTVIDEMLDKVINGMLR